MKRKAGQWLRGNYGEGAEDMLWWRESLSTVMKSKEEAGNKTRVEIGRSIKEKTGGTQGRRRCGSLVQRQDWDGDWRGDQLSASGEGRGEERPFFRLPLGLRRCICRCGRLVIVYRLLYIYPNICEYLRDVCFMDAITSAAAKVT